MGVACRKGDKSYAAETHNLPLNKIKQSSLSEYPTTKARVFISFHVDDEAQVDLLRHQAKTSDTLDFYDYSVKEPFDEKWKTQCAAKLKQCSVVIVAIGKETHNRPAVDWEINKAHELGIPVIGMRIYRDKHHVIPKSMVNNHDKVISWDLVALQREIDLRRKKE